MKRGAAVVHDNIAYIIGGGSHTIYSYRLDRDKWSKHSECPHVNPGLTIINDLLTAVGGKEGDHLASRLCSWNCTKWVEKFPPMQTPREEPAVVHYGKYVIALGGDCKESVELLNIPSLLWSTVSSLPRPLKHITATLCHSSIITMDWEGFAYTINIESLISSISSEESSTEWIRLPECPVNYPTLSSFGGQCLVVSYYGTFQLQERQWVRVDDTCRSIPIGYSIMCVVCDKLVVLGGCTNDFYPYPLTDAVRVAIIA